MKNTFLTLFQIQVFILSLSLCVTSCDNSNKDDFWEDIVKPGDENSKGEMQYYSIPPEELKGWDEGFFYANEDNSICPYYIVSHTDSVNGDIIVCLNETENTNVEKSQIYHFSKEGDILKIFHSGYRFDAQSKEDKVDFIVYDADGKALDGFSVPYIKVDTTAMTSRSPFFNCNGRFSVSKTIDFLEFGEKVTSKLGLVWNLSDGNYGEILADFLLGSMTGAVKSFFSRLLIPLTVKEILTWVYEEAKKCWMGEAAIHISSVKRTSDTTVTVEGEISEIFTIPIFNMYITDGVVEYKENIIRYGVAVGRNSYPGLYLNENRSELEVVNLVEDKYEDEKKFSFTFYKEEEPGEVFYFRPFLVPEAKLKNEDDLFPDPYTCIRYGEAKEFMDLLVSTSNFKQENCTKDREKYNAQFTIKGQISGQIDDFDVQNWGIKVETKSQKSELFGGYRYYANKSESYSPLTNMNFKCNIEIKKEDLENLGKACIAKITITPFVEIGFNLVNKYYEPETYTIFIADNFCPDHNHPHMIDLGLPSGTKWACCNVGASSPEGYGGYYAWGETEEKNNYTASTYSYIQDLYGDGDYYNHDDDWVYIGNDIGGTAYDVAYVLWGENWRMPTFNEMMELTSNCTWVWATINGVNGYIVAGSNNNCIFLPAGDWRVGTGYGMWDNLFRRGLCGFYPSSSLSDLGVSNCTGISFGDISLPDRFNGYRDRGHTIRPVTE